ncbi:hypothetical protein C8R44DRAFT_723535 [Mycena epipterygia]|nr:hypothetical protein C8R44DRAFT_723535 [Mycena epipterygia]
MYDITPAQALLVLVSLIPNNPIRYAMLGVYATITVLYGVHLHRPSVRLVFLENIVGCTQEMIEEAKSLCPLDRHSLTKDEASLLKYVAATSLCGLDIQHYDRVLRFMCILRSTLLQIPGMSWTLKGAKNYWQLCRNIYQCEKEVKMIQVAVKITVEAELERKYTKDIRETEAIVTAVLDPRSQAAMYHQSGGTVNLHHNDSESYSTSFDLQWYIRIITKKYSGYIMSIPLGSRLMFCSRCVCVVPVTRQGNITALIPVTVKGSLGCRDHDVPKSTQRGVWKAVEELVFSNAEMTFAACLYFCIGREAGYPACQGLSIFIMVPLGVI